jgi:hypothetical protein
MLRIELVLLAIAVVAGLIRPTLGSAWLSHLENLFSKLSRRRVLSVVLVGFFALGLRLAVLPVEPIPYPFVHDEFGYLLAADTFSDGRLTNLTHPQWKHFETFNVIQQPTYQSYPQPGQGFVLALGKVVFGDPIWGVWLSAAMMCAAICWMLQGWLPARWALLGGAFAVAQFGIFGYWANSYWGGSLCGTGGALVLGAMPRMRRSRRILDAVLMAIGLALLAYTRPYEGLVFSIPIMFGLIGWWVRAGGRPKTRDVLARSVLPVTAVMLLSVIFLGYYFWRVTGNPFRPPYSVERQTYAVAPYFLWQHLRPKPVYHDAIVEKMYTVDEMNGYHLFRTPAGIMVKLFWSWRFYLGPLLSFPLAMLFFSLPRGFTWRDVKPRTRFLLALLGICIAGLLIETFYAPHYPAPITGLLILFVIMAMRQLNKWRVRERATGLFLVRALPTILLMTLALRAAAGPLRIPLKHFYAPAWDQIGPAGFGREEIENRLMQLPGQHLVIVRYRPEHDPFDEWVYNAADIDDSKIVWARELSRSENQELLDYFKNRKIWLLEADEIPPKLTEYTPSELSLGTSVTNMGVQARKPD